MECIGNTDATRRQRSCRQAVACRSGTGGGTLKSHHRLTFFFVEHERGYYSLVGTASCLVRQQLLQQKTAENPEASNQYWKIERES